jgi:hypothetical protein
MVEFMQQGTTITTEVYCETLRKFVGPFRTKGKKCWHPGKRSSMSMHVRIQLLRTQALWSISTWNCLTTRLTALILFRVTNTYLPMWRTGCDQSASEIVRRWWKEAHRRQTSLTQIYRNLFPDTSASIPAVTMLRSSLITYVFFVYNKLFFSQCLLTTCRRLLFE